MQCEFVVSGTQDIAYVGFPDFPEEVLFRMLRKFLKTIPRLTAEELETPPAMQPDAERKAYDGIYTWIYASVGGSEPTFYASRTAVMLELGTVHYSIATAVGATTVHGAGEVWKHEGELTFNFLSGTFMEKWKLPEGCTLKIMEELLKDKLKQTFAYTRRAKGLAFRKTDPTFISTRFLELTTAELEGYVKEGFKVCIHDKANKAECKSTKSACKKPMERVEDDMRGGDPPTPGRPRRQMEEAKRMLILGEANRPRPTSLPPVPVSKVEGMGGRKKTKKAKKARRKTRRRRYRGGVDDELDPNHIGVQMAEELVGKNPPPAPRGPARAATAPAAPGYSPTEEMFVRLVRELKLKPAQHQYMRDAYFGSLARNVPITEDRLRQHLKAVFKL